MSILNPTPTTLTDAQKLALKIIQDSRRAFSQMKLTFNSSINTLWNSSNATPQEILDALASQGGSAAELFALSNAMVDMMNTFAAANITEIVPAKYTYTINQDGTVTLTEVSSSSSSGS